MKKLAIAAILLISILGQLVAQYPEDLVADAREAIKKFDIQAADQAYKEAMKAPGVDEDAYKEIQAEWQMLEKINIFLADGRRSLERSEYDESVKKYSEAIAQMDASPHDIWGKVKGEASYSKGMVYYRQEKPIKAAEEFRNSMAYDVEESKFGKAIEMVRNKYYSEGHKYYKRKDFVSAKSQYEIAVAVDPSFASGFYQLALIAKKDGDLKLAENYYRDAVTSDPTHYKSWYGLGTLYSEMGNNRKAIESLKMSISINAAYEKAYYVLGKVYEGQKNEKLAIDNLKKAVDVNDKYTKAYELLAKIYNDQEKFETTISLLKGLTGDASSFNTDYRLSQAYNAVQNYSAALTSASSSLVKKKNWAPALIEKGDALLGLERNRDAIAAYRLASKDARWKSMAEYRINELTNWEGK
ncbi:tetratricopeptide repeat protein [bacterium]|nr:tetratricopeptide repeat protein [bacterium]